MASSGNLTPYSVSLWHTRVPCYEERMALFALAVERGLPQAAAARLTLLQ